MEFQCSKCGACCRRAGQSGLMPQREDGACIHLDNDNTCKIYETRPDICRVEKGADTVGKTLGLSKIEYYKANNLLCNEWIKQDNLSDRFRIDLRVYDRTNSS